MQTFRAAAIQLKSGSDRRDNLAQATTLVREAAGSGAELIALPEVFYWRGAQREEAANAEPIPGPTSQWAADLARELSVYLVAGSLLESTPENLKCFNTSLLFGPDGDLLGSYRKIHLFAIDIPGCVSIDENDTRVGGDKGVCIETQLGRIGLAICYDLRFPELFRQLTDDGAEVLVIPSAFTATTGRAHWKTLLRARAVENQCFVVAPNQYGRSDHGFDCYGHSLIVDPWGELLGDGGDGGPLTVSAQLDGKRLEEVRSQLPALGHRRL
jgi:predicted amidohydrolase